MSHSYVGIRRFFCDAGRAALRTLFLAAAGATVVVAALASDGPGLSLTASFDGAIGSSRPQVLPIVSPDNSSASPSQGALMAVPGSFEINSQGAATYTIPIKVVPGTAGVAPNLSLTYSSQGRNGELGIGWSLAGLDSITRCARDMARDGLVGNVNFDSNDRFCIHGQRLVAVSGNYGSNGTEYRTEIESYTRVISFGTSGTGPTYFRVWTKSGQILEFGNSSDSRDLTTTGSGTVRAWLLNKVSDRKGNYYAVTYTNDNANGQVYVSRIDYTGHASNVAPYNSVQFTYGARSDISPSYHGGSLTRATVLMTNIKTFVGSTLVSDYRLGYEASTAVRRSRLTSVTLSEQS